MLSSFHYGPDGELRDESGQSWRRVRSWVEPEEAHELAACGTRYAVQRCQSSPVRGKPERFKRDVLRHMVSRDEAEAFRKAQTVPTVMVGELWTSEGDGDLLLFVEYGPFPRLAEELADDW